MWFLDKGYLIALFSSKDAFHTQALLLQCPRSHIPVKLGQSH